MRHSARRRATRRALGPFLLAVLPSVRATRRALGPFLLAVLASVFPSGSLAAQEASISGTVRSQAGTVIEEVEVTFQPGDVRTWSDDRGRFALEVPAATSGTVRFERDGYMAEALAVLALPPDGTRDVGVTLRSLYTLDALTVVRGRERALLNTDDASTGGALEAIELELLPTDARDPFKLAFNIPGVSQATAFFGDAPLLTISGDNALYTRYTMDGLDNNEGFLGGPRVHLPLSAVRRLQVNTHAFRPAFGRTTNGVVEIETMAGRERWTGEVSYVGRPGAVLDASPKYAPAGVDPDGFERFQIGGALSGPLAQERTFLFTAVEYTDEREDRIGSTARAEFVGTEIRETWKGFARLDHGWTRDQTTTLRFAISDVAREGQGGGVVVPEADITTVRRGTLANLTHRSALRDGTASNELSLQAGTFRWDFPPSRSDLSTPQVTIVAEDSTTVEAVVGSSNFVFDERELQLQFKNVFETRIGSGHTLRAGADVVRSSFELLGANTNPRGAYTVVNRGDIEPSGRFLSIDDVPTDVQVLRYTIDARPQQVDLTQTLVSAFVENRWRITPALTVQGGVRWDYDDLTSRGGSSPDLDNFQPRISANWLPTSNSVLRAGYGVHTGTFPYAVYSDAVQFGPEGNVTVTFEGESFPPPAFMDGPTPEELQELEDELPPREMRAMFARGLEQPYSHQTTLGWQMELNNLWGVSVDGVWVEMRNLPRSWDLNPVQRRLQPGDTVDRPPEFGDQSRPVAPDPGGFRRLTTTDSGGRALHLALHTTVRRSFADRFSIEASWVWSRTRNDTEDINFHATQGNDFDAEWADAVNDRRHHVTVRAGWEPFASLRLGGVADWQSGIPVNRVAYFRDLDGSGTIFGNGFLGNHDRFPGVPRNGERLPGAFRIDGSIAYGIPLPDGVLEVRAEAFNIFNSTLKTGFANGIPGGGPRTQVGRPGDPMEFSTAAPPRQFQLSARWRFR